MTKKALTSESFDDHPVWKWDDDMEGHEPVMNFDPLPEDEGALFIRARFVSGSGEKFPGYLIGQSAFYAAGLFVCGEHFVVNLNLPAMIEADVLKISRLLGDPEFRLFPLSYEDDVRFRKSPRLAGCLDV